MNFSTHSFSFLYIRIKNRLLHNRNEPLEKRDYIDIDVSYVHLSNSTTPKGLMANASSYSKVVHLVMEVFMSCAIP